MSVRFAPTPPR